MALMFREEPKKLNLAYRFYALAVALLLVWAMLLVIFGEEFRRVGDLAYYPSVGLFVAGFVTWIFPKLKILGGSRMGRFGLVATHATILFVAIPISRQFTAAATGLPPQDLDFTVSIVALELYPALWVLICAVVAALFSLGMFLLSALGSVVEASMLGRTYAAVMRIVTKRASEPMQVIEKRRRRFLRKAGLHAMGAMLVAVGAAAVWGWHARFLQAYPDLIRWVAYVTDYYPAPRYLGVDGSKRLHLHENGVVSYAVPNGRAVEILVERVD